jgi:glycyl-tRNA synthetase
MANKTPDTMEKIVALCKRRGFIFQSSEIYGGINGFWDYGPLGVELKRNIKNAWWYDTVHAREDMVGLDCSIIMHPQVWKASGHFDLFSDLMVDCRACKSRFRADHLLAMELIFPESKEGEQHFLIGGLGAPEAIVEANRKKIEKLKKAHGGMEPTRGFRPFTKLNDEGRQRFRCPECDEQGSMTPPREFNLMFKTYVGALIDEDAVAFLRPETAQGIFVNFKNVVDTTRVKIPFGIAQMGKSFRNEITPRNYTFRSREFEQMEIEFFCHPSESNRWYEYWRDARFQWYVSLGLRSEKLRLREHDKEELSHYSCGTSDIEYAFPFLADGEFGELEGVAHRGDYDLTVHMEGLKGADGAIKHKGSGKDLTYFDPERKERYTPHVIEPSAGADRAALAFICEAYTVDESRPSPELMKFHPRLAPIKAAVFPLVAKDGLPEIAHPIYEALRKQYVAQYDAKQSIGKRYARMDEAGTPFCFTIDGQTKEDGTMTVRDRDTGHQERIDKGRAIEYLQAHLGR